MATPCAVDQKRRNTYVASIARQVISDMNSNQAKRYLARLGATFTPGKGGHLIVRLNGRQSILPQHGGSKELGRGLWLRILKQLDVKE